MTASIQRIQIPAASPIRHLLPMGGTNPQGREIQVNSSYLTLDDQPWLPVMGEFHFSRYPRECWEEELLKIKAGGITVVATYLFWIHHEEIEGQFSWSGNNDLRHFIQLCRQVGLYAYPRIGPWAHGECRNGGFPDWLLAKCGSDVRQDAPQYLEYVRRFYQEIFQQVQGLLWKDGGPIIGIQIENELLNNAEHIHTLLQMAREIGFDVPVYTMTGWGPADVPTSGEIIPVFGGYPDAFWDRQIKTWSRNSRKHYFFSHLRDDNTIGADLNKRAGLVDLSYLDYFPFGTCEVGGGMQIAYHRRPLIETDDIAAAAQVKIGNGSNLQGFYMYHGGANPIGQNTTMQESQATGYWNDLPVINYDFQAPIGQYGQVRELYHALRIQHLFLQDFGSILAPMPMTLPEVFPANLDDASTLRWAVRSDGRSGFVFINNYQRVERLVDHPSVQFQIGLPDEDLLLPSHPIEIKNGTYFVWPFNLKMNGALLKYATAQLVCRLIVDGIPTFVFFAQEGIPTEFAFDAQSITAVKGPCPQSANENIILLHGLKPGTDCCITIDSRDGQQIRLLVLTQSQSHHLWKATLRDQDHILLSAYSLSFTEDQVNAQITLPGKLDLSIYPQVDGLQTQAGQPLIGNKDGVFARYALDLPTNQLFSKTAGVQARLIQAAGPARDIPIGPEGVAQAPEDAFFEYAGVWQVRIPETVWSLFEDSHIKEIFMQIKYSGDAARVYLGDRLIDDQFYYGEPWEIGLSRFRHAAQGQELTIRILPLRKDAPIYIPEEQWPDFGDRLSIAEIESIELRIEGMVAFSLR